MLRNANAKKYNATLPLRKDGAFQLIENENTKQRCCSEMKCYCRPMMPGGSSLNDATLKFHSFDPLPPLVTPSHLLLSPLG